MHSTLKFTRHIHNYGHDINIEREITCIIFLNDFSEVTPNLNLHHLPSIIVSQNIVINTYQMSPEYFSTRIGYLTTLKNFHKILLPEMFSLFFTILYLLFSQKHQPIFFRKSFWGKSYLLNFKKIINLNVLHTYIFKFYYTTFTCCVTLFCFVLVCFVSFRSFRG